MGEVKNCVMDAPLYLTYPRPGPVDSLFIQFECGKFLLMGEKKMHMVMGFKLEKNDEGFYDYLLYLGFFLS